MLSNNDWQRLINGLVEATVSDRMHWDEDNSRDQGGIISTITMVDVVQRERLLRAHNGSTYFELSSRRDGSPPYELQITEQTSGGMRLIGSVRSSTGGMGYDRYEVNAALARLHEAVSARVETGTEVVDRLLGDLGF